MNVSRESAATGRPIDFSSFVGLGGTVTDAPKGTLIGLLLLVGVAVLVVTVESKETVDQPEQPEFTSEQVVACRSILGDAEKLGLVRNRPSPNRIDVEDVKWALAPADSKRAVLAALRCDAPGQDYVVAYGYRSGKRLAMASPDFVKFE